MQFYKNYPAKRVKLNKNAEIKSILGCTQVSFMDMCLPYLG